MGVSEGQPQVPLTGYPLGALSAPRQYPGERGTTESTSLCVTPICLGYPHSTRRERLSTDLTGGQGNDEG